MSQRIAYLINQYPQVSHSFIRREILALERQGFEILRIALSGWDAKVADEDDAAERGKTRYLLKDGVLPIAFATLRMLVTSPSRVFSALRLAVKVGMRSQRALPYHLIYVAEACYALDLVKSFGATHLHAHFGTNSSEVAMFIHVLGGPPYSFTVHGQDEPFFGGMREKIHWSSFVVAISSYGRGELYRRAAYDDWHKVKVVHCGLDRAFFSPTPTEPSASNRLLCVGRLAPAKAQLLLIEAAHRLVSKGIKVELVFAGDGEMRPEVEHLISQLELVSRVRITGWISSAQVREELLAARAMVLPSFAEGLPVVIMEAMALHKPVLTTYVSGIPELVRSGKEGWLFPAGSIDELTAAMEDCLTTSPDELKRMGASAYQRVLDRHLIDTEAAKLADLFRQSLADKD